MSTLSGIKSTMQSSTHHNATSNPPHNLNQVHGLTCPGLWQAGSSQRESIPSASASYFVHCLISDAACRNHTVTSFFDQLMVHCDLCVITHPGASSPCVASHYRICPRKVQEGNPASSHPHIAPLGGGGKSLKIMAF